MDVHLAIPDLLGGLVDGGARGGACVVHEDVESAEPGHRRVDRLGPFPLGRDVQPSEDRISAGLCNLSGRPLAVGLVDVGQDHPRALSGEQPRRRAAEPHRLALDPRGGARDQGDLTLQPHGLLRVGASLD